MVGSSKKTAKGRLDKYYHLAKEQGYRARSAFKLIQLNKKFHFLDNARVLIDLCAAPGGWLQVASKSMPMSHLILGVDLAPIRPIPGVITFVNDITTEQCRSNLRRELKDWKADVVLHDGAPNVGSAWVQDAYSQAELVLMSLKLATEMLRPGGTFVSKVFRSKDYNSLIWVFSQLFKKVEATKPASSRNVSAEIFVVCQDFLAPKFIDPKFLDPKSVFQDIELPARPLNIFNPERHLRQRDGYEDGITVLFKPGTLKDFMSSPDPVTYLGSYSTIELPREGSDDFKFVTDTPEEILECCKDLKLLGKREFKLLLKWRQRLVKEFMPKDLSECPEKFKSVVEEEPLSDSEKLDLLLSHEDKKARKQKKKLLMRHAKELVRMRLGMETGKADPEFGNSPDQELFSLSGNLTRVSGSEDNVPSDNLNVSLLTKDEERTEVATKASLMFDRPLFKQFEDDLAHIHESYNAKPVSEMEYYDDDSDALEFEDEEAPPKSTTTSRGDFSAEVECAASGARSKRKHGNVDVYALRKKLKKYDSDNDDIEFVRAEDKEDLDLVADKMTVLSPEGMTTALALKSGQKSKRELVDGSFNRYSYSDKELLPSWFREDESKHNKPLPPVTKEAMDAIRQKLKVLENKPSKKVLEAKLRKKGKYIKKLEGLKGKAGLINENEELSEAQKAGAIQKLLRNASKGSEPKKRPALVIAKGANRGIKSRPKGVKGRYKMIDARMKKEARAMKRKLKNEKKRK